MNKSFSITLMILSVVAVLSTLLLRHVDATNLNDNFRIETLYGDPNLINDIFEISNIRQEGTNQFSRVVLTTTTPEISGISFDSRHQLDDRQLENREFYRGTFPWQRGGWGWSGSHDTTNFQIFTIWGNYKVTYRILNTETGEFIAIPTNFNQSNNYIFTSWVDVFFIERDGALYHISAQHDQLNASVYRVNFTTEQIEYQFTVSQETDAVGNWFATEHGLYFYGHNWTWSTAQSRGTLPDEIDPDALDPSDNPFYGINFETQEIDELPAPIGISDSWSFGRFGDYILTQGILTYNLEGDRIIASGYTLVNLESGERHIFQAPEPTHGEWIEPTQYHALGDFLVGVTRSDQFNQDVVIYEMSTMEKIYHGRISLRRDQGLVLNDWGWVRNYEIKLR